MPSKGSNATHPSPVVAIRMSMEERLLIEEAMRRNPDAWQGISHFVRTAAIGQAQRLVERKVRK
jgi:uncharacterized protein (DUF1778 family)